MGEGVSGLERTHFQQFPTLVEGVVVLKELIFNSFYFGQGVVVLKELISKQFLLLVTNVACQGKGALM